jgi:uncharacterized membrane protein
MNYKKLGYLCLDYFTRTWAAFWGTLAFCLFYIFWQYLGPPAYHFDRFPFLGLCTVVTLLSYFQNIIIMTIQREEHEKLQKLEKIEAKREAEVFEMIEEMHEGLSPIIEELVENDGTERQPQSRIRTFWKKTRRGRKR